MGKESPVCVIAGSAGCVGQAPVRKLGLRRENIRLLCMGRAAPARR